METHFVGKSHYKKYGVLARKFISSISWKNKQYILQKYRENPTLDNLPTSFFVALCNAVGKSNLQPHEKVCLGKHIIVFYIAGIQPVVKKSLCDDDKCVVSDLR